MRNIAEMVELTQRRIIRKLACSSCGSVADASCSCGAPYVPAIQRAAEAVAVNPQKSNRALANEVGVSEPTVRRARETGASDDAPVERLGRDGKLYRLARHHEEPKPEPPRKREAFLVFSNEAMLLAAYDGPVDDEIVKAAKATEAAWSRLVESITERRIHD